MTTQTDTLHHDPLAVATNEACVARVVLHCQMCRREPVHCHVRDSAIRQEMARAYLCDACVEAAS